MNQVPLFVKLENYDQVVDTIEDIKNKIEEAKHLLDEISELKSEEDSHIEKWKEQLTEAEERVIGIDKTISKPEVL